LYISVGEPATATAVSAAGVAALAAVLATVFEFAVIFAA
jgi:hypothetical protein